jgi:exodeoxyribonuclease VII small subunit
MSDQPEQLKLMMPAAPTKKASKSADAALKSTKPPLGKQPIPPSESAFPSVQEPTAPEVKTTMPEATKSADFETMLVELEKVVAQLDGELKLEEALALFERGMGLSKNCEEFLKTAQQKIEVLKRSTNGSVQTEPFADEAEMAT